MRIDCSNLACPEPVIKTKNALESMEEGILEVVVNSESSRGNITRFATKQGLPVSESSDGDKTILTITKGYACEIASESGSESKVAPRTIFLKDDKIGESGLGEKLVVGFLNVLNELPKPPREIICVNKAVYLTTQNEAAVEVFKKLIEKGTEVYSCGICLEYYGILDELKVGEVGNAYATMETLLGSEGVVSL